MTLIAQLVTLQMVGLSLEGATQNNVVNVRIDVSPTSSPIESDDPPITNRITISVVDITKNFWRSGGLAPYFETTS